MRTALTRHLIRPIWPLFASAVLALTGCEGDSSSGTSPLSAAPAQAEESLSDGASIAGTWVLNREESERPPGPRGGPRRHGHRHGPGPGSFDAPPWDCPNHDVAAGDTAGAQAPGACGRLVITLSGDLVTIAHGRRPALEITADGTVVTREGRDGETVSIIAVWEESDLVVTRSHGERSLVERFVTSDDGGRLTVVRTPSNPPGGAPREIRLVFDRVGD